MTKYPVVLVHGIAIREYKHVKAFGKIGATLNDAGCDTYTAGTDAFGSIENNAEQLKRIILEVCEKSGLDKVNIIAHSKGGLDTKYMLAELDMADRVASFTTLCTPHRGSVIATHIWRLPMFVKKYLAFFINGFYKLVGDKNPDSLKVCEQLKSNDASDETDSYSEKVYCQSYSTKIQKGSDCLLMAVPMTIYNVTDGAENDGMVSEDSAKFLNYRGECLDEAVSHTQIVDFFAKRSHRRRILSFYVDLCRELGEMGY